MKIFVIGTRGIPDIPGGVEKHCEELYPRIAARGHQVMLSTRKFYVAEKFTQWGGVKLIHCYAPHKKCFEAIVHTFLALISSLRRRPDIVHFHSIGPALLIPVARLLGYKVVMTNHGADYARKKWGWAARMILRFGEKLGGSFANEVISVSSVGAEIIGKRCNRISSVIHNGVPLAARISSQDFLKKIGVVEKEYLLAVARLVPEKGLHDLVKAFISMNAPYKLVIAGDADHETDYSRHLRKMAAADRRIILTGYITGDALREVYSHARLFVLPSYHEGLPIAMLEAMSYGLSVLVSDIPANREVGLPLHRYFSCGNIEDLKEKISLLLEKSLPAAEREQIQILLKEQYNWDTITNQTLQVYQKLLTEGAREKGWFTGRAASIKI